MLTAKQRTTYNLVRFIIAKTGRAPTYRAIARMLGISNWSAYASVSRICKRGWLRRTRNVLSVSRYPSPPTTTEMFDYFSVDYENLTKTGWPRLVDLALP